MNHSIKVHFLVLIVTMLVSLQGIAKSTNHQEENNRSTVDTSKVEVYYFHLNRRCSTCKTVEAVAKNLVQELSGGKVPFYALNLEEKDGDAKAIKHDVRGQTLLVVKGDHKVNLTNDGFVNARNHPKKLRKIIKKTIDNM